MTRGPFGRASEAVRASTTATVLARSGLVARAGFYLLLAYLVLGVLFADRSGPTNAAGALHAAAATPLGALPIALAAVGFFMFGISRLLGAIRDSGAGRTARITTGLQGLFYLALTQVPAAYLLGDRSTGSEQQARSSTAQLLALPAGRDLLAGLGLGVVGVCLWQGVTAFRTDFTGSLRLDDAPAWVRLLVRVTGRVGIISRALVFAPIGVFLVVAAFRHDSSQAKGMDAVLGMLAHNTWGRVLLGAVVTGFVVFATYSALEARYRDVDAGD